MDKDLARSLGQAARQARKALGLTQANMAERLGVHAEFYGRIERCVALPSVQILLRMVETLRVRADVLLDLKALRAAMAASSTGAAPAEPSALRALLPMLRDARPGTLRIVRMLLDELEPTPAARKRARRHDLRKSPPKNE